MGFRACSLKARNTLQEVCECRKALKRRWKFAGRFSENSAGANLNTGWTGAVHAVMLSGAVHGCKNCFSPKTVRLDPLCAQLGPVGTKAQ